MHCSSWPASARRLCVRSHLAIVFNGDNYQTGLSINLVAIDASISPARCCDSRRPINGVRLYLLALFRVKCHQMHKAMAFTDEDNTADATNRLRIENRRASIMAGSNVNI